MLDFLGIGASKTGTTWVYNAIKNSPQILFPNGKKATVFWNQDLAIEMHEMGFNSTKLEHRNIQWYLDLYSDVPGKLLGDITDGNSYISSGRIREIKETVPNVKIIYGIRNPITTSWSHVKNNLPNVCIGYENDSAKFNQLLSLAKQKYFVLNTRYYDNLTRWTEVFDISQIHMYFFADILNDPRGVLEKVGNFLAIDNTYLDHIDIRSEGNQNKGLRVPLNKAMLAELRELHQDQIEKMQEYFQRDFSHWLRGDE